MCPLWARQMLSERWPIQLENLGQFNVWKGALVGLRKWVKTLNIPVAKKFSGAFSSPVFGLRTAFTMGHRIQPTSRFVLTPAPQKTLATRVTPPPVQCIPMPLESFDGPSTSGPSNAEYLEISTPDDPVYGPENRPEGYPEAYSVSSENPQPAPGTSAYVPVLPPYSTREVPAEPPDCRLPVHNSFKRYVRVDAASMRKDRNQAPFPGRFISIRSFQSTKKRTVDRHDFGYKGPYGLLVHSERLGILKLKGVLQARKSLFSLEKKKRSQKTMEKRMKQKTTRKRKKARRAKRSQRKRRPSEKRRKGRREEKLPRSRWVTYCSR